MKITGETKTLGIFGYPVSHTLSPIMQNAAIEALGLDYTYLPFEVRPEELGYAVRGLKALNIAGVNVTVPHKERVIQFLDEATDEARLIGSVNTIENRNGVLIGHNTDSRGYIRSLREEAGFEPEGKNVLIIGAGGAARGIIAGLAIEGAFKIFIANRTVERGKGLGMEFGNKFKDIEFAAFPLSSLKDPQLLSSIDLVVNATSMGLEGQGPDIDFTSTPIHTLVSDIVYKPPVTVFLEKAKNAGRKTVGGVGMLIYQGAISFEIWTSRKAPVDVMKRVIQPVCEP